MIWEKNMKKLYIVRNAHAAIGAIDRERELDERGVMEVDSIGAQMVAAGMRPSVILTSGVRRSIETAKRIREIFGLLVNVIDIREELYNADIRKILDILQSLPDEKSSVMLIANNQGVTDLLGSITNSEYKEIPNGSLVMVELRLRHWRDIESQTGRELLFLEPKLKDMAKKQ
jgi:phosphohistidine phosphatase